MSRNTDLKPRKIPSQRRAVETVEAILVAAAQVFEAEGHAATTDRIAARAGVSVGSLYQYFPNKGALLVALYERHVAGGLALARSRIGQAPGAQQDLEAWLHGLIGGMLALHRAQPRLQHMLVEGLVLPPDLHDRVLAAEDELVGLVQAEIGRLTPTCAGPQPRAAAWLLLHTIQSLVHDYALHAPEGIPEQDFVRGLAGMLVAWLFPSGPVARGPQVSDEPDPGRAIPAS